MTWLVVGSIVAVLAIGGHLLTRGWPLVPRLLFATGLLVAAPTLIAQGLGGTAWIFGQLSPVSGPLAWLILLAPAGVAAGLLALLHGVAWFDIGRLPLGLMAVALVLFAVVTAPILAIGLSTGEPQQAEHTWQARLEPGEDGQAYTVELPFFEAPEPGDRALLDRLRERLVVDEGQGRVELVEDGRWLRVEAQGPVEIRAEDAYYGTVGHRELMTDLTVPTANGTLTADGDLSLMVEITYSFSGGSGHTCWAQGGIEGVASEPGPVPLYLVHREQRTPIWETDTAGLPTVCA